MAAITRPLHPLLPSVPVRVSVLLSDRSAAPRRGVGCISATANVNPGAIARLFATWNVGQAADADTQQERLNEIRGIFAKYPMIPALKAAIAHYGGDPSWATVRPPLVELTPQQKASLAADLDSAGFAMPGLKA